MGTVNEHEQQEEWARRILAGSALGRMPSWPQIRQAWPEAAGYAVMTVGVAAITLTVPGWWWPCALIVPLAVVGTVVWQVCEQARAQYGLWRRARLSQLLNRRAGTAVIVCVAGVHLIQVITDGGAVRRTWALTGHHARARAGLLWAGQIPGQG